MNKCERCGREFRTIQELHGHQRIEDIGRVLGLVLMDLHRAWTWAWTLLSSHFIAIVGAIIGGVIGTYPAGVCGFFFIICGPVLGVIGGVVGGLIGGAIHHLLFRRTQDSAGRSFLSGCLSLLGLGFLGLLGSLISLIFWLVVVPRLWS